MCRKLLCKSVCHLFVASVTCSSASQELITLTKNWTEALAVSAFYVHVTCKFQLDRYVCNRHNEHLYPVISL